MIKKEYTLTLVFALLLASSTLFAQKKAADRRDASASKIAHEIEKLGNTARILYVAAHPDDENTNLLAWLAEEKKVEAAYFSFTRGDGGQNLIGSDLKEKLGIIRAFELQEARKVDGAHQYFSRAYDYGYSKTPDEAFDKWNRDSLLSDLVYVIRKLKPQLIITRFSETPKITHGHHTAATLMAVEAYELAADPNQFKSSAEKFGTWQVDRIYWNASPWFFRRNPQAMDSIEFVTEEIGNFLPKLGSSIGQIAADSRSMHKSQGFGARQELGSIKEYFQLLKGHDTSSLLENIPTHWGSIGMNTIDDLILKILDDFSIHQPENSVNQLITLKKAILKIDNPPSWIELKLDRIDQIIFDCLGFKAMLLAGKSSFVIGDSIDFSLNIWNRSNKDVKAISVSLEEENILIDSVLDVNRVNLEWNRKLSKNHSPNVFRYLNEPLKDDFYAFQKQEDIINPVSPYPMNEVLILEIEGELFEYPLPVQYLRTDPVDGEVSYPVRLQPEFLIDFKNDLLIFSNTNASPVDVEITFNQELVKGKLSLTLPTGWKSEPSFIELSDVPKGKQDYRFLVKSSIQPQKGQIFLKLETSDQVYDQSMESLEYEHIPHFNYFKKASADFINSPINLIKEQVSYIQGAGDEIPKILTKLGMKVNDIKVEDISKINPKDHPIVVLGIRAFNVHSNLDQYEAKLMEYVEEGGHLVIQYNTSWGYRLKPSAPYPLKVGVGRVTDEASPVAFVNEDHPILNQPNPISLSDFDGWIQERGLYFPEEWSEEYLNFLELSDPDEEAQGGSILYAEYGKGSYVYTSLSFFRQMPAGVPGASKLFINLLRPRSKDL
ncbi:MAG: PIG-L family deacetylase [Cyclobacteriaceae bacterium]|nr:PIG-L family deacetylase [Cyclobacteriaceae bacterium]MCH8517061.1 PIG-L family deacetylase [Cyclobacteriaceae bacterium]